MLNGKAEIYHFMVKSVAKDDTLRHGEPTSCFKHIILISCSFCNLVMEENNSHIIV